MVATLSRHARLDRAERIDKIIDLLDGDFGATIIRYWDEMRQSYSNLTENGVLIITDYNNKVITMYFCSIDRATAVAHKAHKRLTENQINRIKKNYEKFKIYA